MSAAGLSFHPVRPSLAQMRADHLGLDERAMMERAMADPAFVIRDLSMPYLRLTYDDVESVIRGARLVVTTVLAFSARLAAEKRGAGALRMS